MIARLLSILFPPRLPGRMDWEERAEYDEQGSCGVAKPKQYRDGIDRFFKEDVCRKYLEPKMVRTVMVMGTASTQARRISVGAGL